MCLNRLNSSDNKCCPGYLALPHPFEVPLMEEPNRLNILVASQNSEENDSHRLDEEKLYLDRTGISDDRDWSKRTTSPSSHLGRVL